MDYRTFAFAFGLTILAGLSTGGGSALAFFTKRISSGFLAGALGFSAGVMIYVSMIEIFGKARSSLSAAFGGTAGYLYTTLGFFGGIALIGAIDKLVPSFENPHEVHGVEELKPDDGFKGKVHRMGLFSALAIGIHNFPEGLATLIGALEDPTVGVSIAVAVAIHNVPEGIAVSVPLFYATGSRRRAFWLSFLSGLAEPVGALVGFFLLRPFMGEATFGMVFAVVAGIMVYISLDELLPTAEKVGQHHIAIYGLISGMAVMAGSLLLFA